jgi:DNA-binding FadR family transcriptional regulator
MTNGLRFQSVTRSSIYVQVADQIRAAIFAGSLPSGERLPPERELAQQFGVSRATLREALRHLQAQGLLAPRGRTSPLETAGPDVAAARFCEALTQVVRLRDVSLPDLVELRIAIETAALARAAAAPVAARLDEAHVAIAKMEGPDTSPAEFHRSDVAFHAALVAASGNQALHLVMLAVEDSVRLRLEEELPARRLAKLRPRIVEEHRSILSCVERGNGKAAAALLRAHLRFYGT